MAFDWIKFHKELHKKKYVDPQAAEIKTKAGKTNVLYSFFLRHGVETYNQKTKDNLERSLLDAAIEMKHRNPARLAQVQSYFLCHEYGANLAFLVETDGSNRNGEITAIYAPKSRNEANKILAYLNTLPADCKEHKMNEHFFCYD